MSWVKWMNDPVMRVFREALPPRQDDHMPLGRDLIEHDLITPWQLFYALRAQRRWQATLSDILRSRGWISDHDLRNRQAARFATHQVDLTREPPDPRLASHLPPHLCLKYCLVPWAIEDGVLTLAIGRADRFEEIRPQLPPDLRSANLVVAPEDQVMQYLSVTHRKALTTLAETRVAPQFSCRGWDIRTPPRTALLLGLLACAALMLLFLPGLLFAGVMAWALLSLLIAAVMKNTALILHMMPRKNPPLPPPSSLAPLPRISVMVPLFREKEIAHALIRRLTRLTYPRALLDVVLVLEEKDTLTRQTIAQTRLPRWMRVVQVPAGSGLTTKPRALNYALDFCKGDIIGIWDAEDAPAKDQLEQVARHFAHAAPDVACLQGVLDYYNPYTNWLSRCFTIEYATWFRIVLPGLARMGLAVPLGGTTLFLRRAAIEHVGGWDAHNVTEDADLGYRLARFGYRTELMHTVTQEEANCRPIAWIRQRSRWLKGFMITYLVHMRAPRQLWRDLGPRKFFGFHMVFMTTLTQFVLAPLIWSFWGAALGFGHPLAETLPPAVIGGIAALMISAGIMSALIALTSILGQGRERLYPFVLTMAFYFPLATLAAYKALIELLIIPYYWDKTAHGKTAEGTQAHTSFSSE